MVMIEKYSADLRQHREENCAMMAEFTADIHQHQEEYRAMKKEFSADLRQNSAIIHQNLDDLGFDNNALVNNNAIGYDDGNPDDGDDGNPYDDGYENDVNDNATQDNGYDNGPTVKDDDGSIQ